MKCSLHVSRRGWNRRTISPLSGSTLAMFGPLEPVAMHASKGEVIGSSHSTVLASNNVIYLEWRWVKR